MDFLEDLFGVFLEDFFGVFVAAFEGCVTSTTTRHQKSPVFNSITVSFLFARLRPRQVRHRRQEDIEASRVRLANQQAEWTKKSDKLLSHQESG